MTTPDWADEEAERLCSEGEYIIGQVPIIAAALRAADQRGYERGERAGRIKGMEEAVEITLAEANTSFRRRVAGRLKFLAASLKGEKRS